MNASIRLSSLFGRPTGRLLAAAVLACAAGTAFAAQDVTAPPPAHSHRHAHAHARGHQAQRAHRPAHHVHAARGQRAAGGAPGTPAHRDHP